MIGAVRWFIPAPANGVNDVAPLTITGFAEACRHDPHSQEGIEPLEFYRTGNQRMGRRIDLNGRLNGNLKIRRASFF